MNRLMVKWGFFRPIKNQQILKDSNVSEKFELLSRRICFNRFGSLEYFYVAELLVGDAQYRYMAVLWKECPHTFYVRFGILHAGTMADRDWPLEHGEAVALEVFAKKGIVLLVHFRLRR